MTQQVSGTERAPHELPDPPELKHWLREAARRWPQGLALRAAAESCSYETLLRQVLARAQELQTAGVAPGDRIAIAATRSIRTIVDILAVVEAGAAYVPLDLGYPAERLSAMLQDATPRMVLGEPEVLAQLEAVAGQLPSLQRPAAANAAPYAAAADLTYVLFTSGSTGRPKGVAMGARPLRHLIAWHADHPQLGQPARTLQFAPLSFDVHFQEIFSTLACGGCLVLLDDAKRRDPAQLCAALRDQQVERIFLPYVALQMLAEAARTCLPAHLRDVVSAGEQLQVTPAIRWLFKQLPGAGLHNHYGPTESHVVTAHELYGDADQWPVIPPIGRALPHVQLALRDAESGDIDATDTGELLLGGDTLAHGYLGRPDLSTERFRDDIAGLAGRWYTTGDLVQRDADGVCTYLGRADQQLKVDGFRIEPGEIEVVLMTHEAVRDAVVTAPELPGIGKQLVAHLVLRTGPAAPDLAATLRAYLRERLPEYMVPVRYLVLDRLPTTPSGKIDRRALPLPQVETAAQGDPASLVRALWEELLGVPQIADDANLFELGAKSLLVLRFVTRLRDAGVQGISVADVYDRPTLAGIRAALDGPREAPRRVRTGPRGDGGIAIVGMATRTAGAADVEQFWDNLVAGREGIRHFSPAELDPSVPESVRSRSNFVAARGVLEDAGRFDAAFFGISAREATLLDPQQRLFLELCWTALEHAAIDPGRTDERIGVYGGTANNSYIAALRSEQPELIAQSGEFAAMLASEKDYVATRVANRLNLNGPAVSVHTACSTGLVAVAQAWHALASGLCDVALAGGATVVVPQEGGYLHVEGGMESADGHCRPFDADATGTVFASGGGVVVLKRLEDALADGDTVFAVIRGVGLNNDGGDKASFTAPSVTGQAGAIRMALEHAQVNARSIGYVEAHGTGTALGDPIEVAALTRAWRDDTGDAQFCGIGSLKSNLGHTVAAAGVLGLVKAALSLHRELIPGTLHFRRPNPQIDFAATPFQVVAHNTPWPRAGQPRRAAVSSFGVGGTNAHVIVEEAPQGGTATAGSDGRLYLLPLSARTPEAALKRAHDLAAHLQRHPALALADVAATLMRGRRPMNHRLCVTARDTAAAATALAAAKSAAPALVKPRVVFLFPGQGSQHAGMARKLYDEAPAFREALDRCLAQAGPELGAGLRTWMLDAEPGDAQAGEALAQTCHAQPALFSMSYALAAWLDSLGVQPDAMIGHSIGEYAAACHAGVFSLADAMQAVIARGQAMYAQPRGAMLAVRTGIEALAPLLPAGVEVAGCNAPALTVLAGDAGAIDTFAKVLEARDIGTTRLRVSHAFHSATMDGALPAVAAALQQARLQAPGRTLYSCISGAPLRADEATDAHYWARQVRATVQFSRAVQAELARDGDCVFVEVGPGQALTALLRQHRTRQNAVPRVVALLGPAQDPGDAAVQALTGLGALWCAGVDVAWPVAAMARRVPLPTYPFQGDRHWFTRRAPALAAAATPTAASSVGLAVDAPPVPSPSAPVTTMSRLPRLEQELKRILCDVSGVAAEDIASDASFVDQGLDSLSLTQATLELERVFGVKLRFRRLLEDLDTLGKLGTFLDGELPADRFAPPAAAPATAPETPVAAVTPAGTPAVAPAQTLLPSAPLPTLPVPLAGGSAVHQLLQQQMQLMSQQLALLAGQPVAAAAMPVALPVPTAPPATPAAAAQPAVASSGEPEQPSIKALIEKPFGAAARITLDAQQDDTPEQHRWLEAFIARYNAKTGKSKSFSQQHRKLMSDPRVVTGFNPLWKDLVYPIVADRSKGARIWDVDGNEYIDLLSCFGANLLGYQPDDVVDAMAEQLKAGIEVGPQHPLSAEVAQLISEFTGHERVAFCNTGSEAVMGAMRIARTVTGRKTIAIFTNSYHGIFDEVIVRGTRQLRSLSAAPGILANAVENVLVLDYASDDALRVLRERGSELAAIMIEPIQNKYPTLQPREFVRELRRIADGAGCALIFDEVVTGFRVAPGGAQEFYGVRADICTYGKVIGGGLPFAAIGGASHWLDALDGGHWQYGDDSYPEAGVTYFAGTFVRHPLALAAAKAALLHLKRGGREFYRSLNERTQGLVDRLNTAFAVRGAPVKAVHCASLWRLSWDDGQKYVSLFYYLVRYHGLHLYEQFGHFVTDAMGEAELDRIFTVFTSALDELMTLGFIQPRPGTPPPSGGRTFGDESGPLTPGQTERWLAASFDPHARRALNESLCLVLRGDVNLDALEQAVRDVLGRHEAFRLRFDLDEPRQVVDAQARVELRKIDLRGQADGDAALDAFCSEASERDFPLDQAPLAAVSLLQLSDGRVVVHMVASHLVFDGWASPVMLGELAQAYRARLTGYAAVLPPAESPRRFAVDEAARVQGPRGREDLAYWSDVLRNPPALLSLGDRTPPSPRRYAADTVRTRFEPPLHGALLAQARRANATLFQLLLAAVTMSLARRSGQPEFVVSIPYAGQSLQRHGPLIADGVLDLPLRLRCDEGEAPAAVLARVRNHLMDALEHPLVTQGTVARALDIVAKGDRPAFSGVFFNLNPKVDLSAFAPLQATMHEGRKRGLLSELFFNFYETSDGLTLDLHHSSEFFSPQRAGELVQDLRTVCESLAQSLDQPARPAADAAHAADTVDARLRAWNRTDRPMPPHARVEQWVSAQALQTPDAMAVEAPDGRLTYRELESRANRLANLLRQRGAGPGERVGLCLSRGVDLVPALLAVLKTGAAYVPLDPGFPRDRLQYMQQDAALKLVLTESRHAALVDLPRERQLRVDDDRALIDATPDMAGSASTDADAPAYVIYTSGSTGKPKGVIVLQRGVMNFLASMQREPGLLAADRLLAVTTLSFDIAVLELLLPLVTGARLVLAQREDAMDGQALSALISRHGITVMQATPTTWHLLLDEGWTAPAGFRGLCGGEALPPALARRLLGAGVTLWNMYGPTETTVWSTVMPITDAERISIGHPIANTTVWILDAQGNHCAVGVAGEICIGGTGVAGGYWQRTDLTSERFIADPFDAAPGARLYRTGDLGRWREDGTLEHMGRMDHQVKVRGYRIELGEIEAQLDAAPGVSRSVVVTREDTPGDVRLVAYAVPAAGSTLDAAALRTHLKRHLPDYMVPAQFVPMPQLPLLPNGKIDRKSLPAPAEAAALAAPVADTQPKADPAPQNHAVPGAEELARLMGEVLGSAPLQRDDNFFELGGHSLLAAKLASRLSRVCGRRIGLKTLFEAPTPASLAAALAPQHSQASTPAPAAIERRADQRSAPMSLMQQRLWFLEQLDPDTPVHNVPSAHRLKGPMQLEALQQALRRLVERQSVLRTWFERTPEGAVQRILEHLDVPALPVTDLSALPAGEREDTMQSRIAAMVKTPIALDSAPLFRVHLFRLGAQEHVLFFMAHHIIWDGWSFDLLYRELSELYGACVRGTEPQLPALPIAYGDFAAWQQAWMQGDELARQTAHWRERLSPLPEPLELPLDQPRPPKMSGRGASYTKRFSPDMTRALHQLAQRQGTTLYVTLLAAYSALLYRLTQQSDLVIGTPVRGREQPELEALMGFFVNALPLRLQPQPELPFHRWLKRVQDTVTDAFTCPDVPFEHLVRELNVPRDPSRPMIYQTMFSFQDARERPLDWGDLSHARATIGLHGASEDLSLWCVEVPGGIECTFTYAADLFKRESVVRVAERFELLLQQALADADQPIGRYRTFTPAEQTELDRWNATDTTGHDTALTVDRLLAGQAQRTPAVSALRCGGQQLSYAELDARSNRLAHELRSHGISRGALVGLCVERSIEMVVTQLAILKAGAAYVPLDPAFPAERLAYMADDARLALLVTEAALTSLLPWPRERTLLLDGDAARIASRPATAVPADELAARPDDPAYVIYTSGSTGRPKGVVVPHRAVVNFLLSMAREPGLTSSDRLLAVTTLSFDIAVLELLLPLTVGAQVVLASRDDAIDGQALCSLLLSSQATVMQATPATWRMLIEAGWAGSPAFKALIGGEALPADLAAQLLERTGELWNMYGPTETTVWSTCCKVSSLDAGISIGRPIANTQVHILDERLQPCPIGVPGEICIGGDGVTLGYLHRPELTADRFIDDPWRPGAKLYRTGDRGRWRHDGMLEHQGRMDFQVKVRGYRIELGEIETTLASHPQVARTVVIVREDRPGDARLVAYVVPRGDTPQPHALREHLRLSLPDYMLPQHFVAIDAIPLLPNGKIDRKALPAPTDAGPIHDATFVAPHTEAQIAIADIWKRLLAIDQVALSDNFFDLGGHSLLAMRAVGEMEPILGCRIPVRRMIFETLAQLAADATPAPQTAAASAQPRPAKPWFNRLLNAVGARASSQARGN